MGMKFYGIVRSPSLPHSIKNFTDNEVTSS